MDLKNEDTLEYEDALRNKDDIKNIDNLIKKTVPDRAYTAFDVFVLLAFNFWIVQCAYTSKS